MFSQTAISASASVASAIFFLAQQFGQTGTLLQDEIRTMASELPEIRKASSVEVYSIAREACFSLDHSTKTDADTAPAKHTHWQPQPQQRVTKARKSPGAVTCRYSGLLFRSCSVASAYAAETQVAGRPSLRLPLPFFFPFFFPFFGLEALKYPARIFAIPQADAPRQ